MTQTQQVHFSSDTSYTTTALASDEAWAEELELITQKDRDFFLQNPTERFYIRSITPVEILEARAVGRFLDANGFMLVGEVTPGCRTRLFFDKDETPPLSQFREMKKQFQQTFDKKTNRPQEQFKSVSKARPKANGFG